jgi:hypothetical protein
MPRNSDLLAILTKINVQLLPTFNSHGGYFFFNFLNFLKLFAEFFVMPSVLEPSPLGPLAIRRRAALKSGCFQNTKTTYS